MRRAGVFVVGSVAMLALAACGSDSSAPASSAGTGAPATTTEPGAAPSTPATSPAASSAAGSAEPTAGAAPAGSAIKAGASTSLPATVGSYAKQAGSGPATIYSSEGKLISVSFLPGSNYASIVTAIKAQQTPAGTGRCGVTTSADNVTCYLKAADGVYNLSADAGEAPVPTVAAFANVLAATIGTS